jgi:hypothetical protein
VRWGWWVSVFEFTTGHVPEGVFDVRVRGGKVFTAIHILENHPFEHSPVVNEHLGESELGQLFVFFIDRVVGTVLTVQDQGIVVGVLMVVREDIVDPGFFLVGGEGGMDQVVLVRQGEGIDEESGGRRVTEDVLDIVETDLVVTG